MTLRHVSRWQQGWLTSKLLGVTLSSAEWVLWLLVALSVLSIAVMLERVVYFSAHRLPNSEELARAAGAGRARRGAASCIEAAGAWRPR